MIIQDSRLRLRLRKHCQFLLLMILFCGGQNRQDTNDMTNQYWSLTNCKLFVSGLFKYYIIRNGEIYNQNTTFVVYGGGIHYNVLTPKPNLIMMIFLLIIELSCLFRNILHFGDPLPHWWIWEHRFLYHSLFWLSGPQIKGVTLI